MAWRYVETPSRIFDAKYPFTCACCGERFEPGTPAYYDTRSKLRNGDPDHIWPVGGPESDVETTEAPAPKSPPCTSCFTHHGPGQTECW